MENILKNELLNVSLIIKNILKSNKNENLINIKYLNECILRLL
jgi:hypothetical protein